MPSSQNQMQNCHHSSRSAKKSSELFDCRWSGPRQLRRLRALASSALSVPWPAPPSPYLVSSYFVFFFQLRPLRARGQVRRLWSRTSATISELWPAPPSLSPFQLRCLRTLTSSGLLPRASSAVSKPVPAPPPSPSAFQLRCLQILVSSAVSEPRPASPSPRPGRDPPSPGSGRDPPSPGPGPAPPSPSPGPAPPFPSTFQLRRLLSLAKSAVSEPPKSSGPWASSRFRAPGQLHRFRIFQYESTYTYTRTSSRTGPGLPPPPLKVGGQLPICPLLLRHWCRSFSLACARLEQYLQACTFTTNWLKWTNHSDEKSISGGL